ncbi:hypothetical protein BH23CHL2_BH23CHL2_28430 [soil metagenome]
MILFDCHQLGLMSRVAVVRDGVHIVDLSRRNQNIAIDRSPVRSSLIKSNPSSNHSATRERWLYELIHEEAGTVSEHVPCMQHDGDSLLSIEYFPGAISINQLIERDAAFPIKTASELGTWLGALHTAKELQIGVLQPSVSGELPWALFVDQPTTNLIHSSSGATIRLLRTVQQHPDICDALMELRECWVRDSLIHNDLKWDNIIILRPSIEAANDFMVIDWELAGLGDSRWDVGSIFAAFLTLWVGSIPIMRDAPPDHLLDFARHPITLLQPAIQSFWSAYIESTRLRQTIDRPDIEPIMRFCGARLIQIAIERAQLNSTLAADSVVLLQVAQNIFRQPRQAASSLFALPTM